MSNKRLSYTSTICPEIYLPAWKPTEKSAQRHQEGTARRTKHSGDIIEDMWVTFFVDTPSVPCNFISLEHSPTGGPHAL